jgi:mannose-1-phosphate guanylyltransferase
VEKPVSQQSHLWSIVLAAGDGRRVSGLTTDAEGAAVPKQYCSFGRPRPMLHWALDRACGLVPPEHVVVVVAAEHRRHWERELASLPAENVVVQPQNRGTAAGILLPLLQIFPRRDPHARVLVLPSDHYVDDERTLRASLRRAAQVARRRKALVLLGMIPGDADPEYGWILPDASALETARVAGFVEKPDRETAAELRRLGALLSSFMFVADAGALVRLYAQTLPALLELFLAGDRGAGLAELYASLPISDFSRDVLEQSLAGVAVLPVADCGWTDLGTPRRIEAFLAHNVTRRAAAHAPRQRRGPRPLDAA